MVMFKTSYPTIGLVGELCARNHILTAMAVEEATRLWSYDVIRIGENVPKMLEVGRAAR